MAENTLTRLRAFRLGAHQKDGSVHPTSIEVCELSDGTFEIGIFTERKDLDPASTVMRLTPATFQLLSESMFRAAHDPTVWHPIPQKENNDGTPVDPTT